MIRLPALTQALPLAQEVLSQPIRGGTLPTSVTLLSEGDIRAYHHSLTTVSLSSLSSWQGMMTQFPAEDCHLLGLSILRKSVNAKGNTTYHPMTQEEEAALEL